jgi:hypothetical protein
VRTAAHLLWALFFYARISRTRFRSKKTKFKNFSGKDAIILSSTMSSEEQFTTASSEARSLPMEIVHDAVETATRVKPVIPPMGGKRKPSDQQQPINSKRQQLESTAAEEKAEDTQVDGGQVRAGSAGPIDDIGGGQESTPETTDGPTPPSPMQQPPSPKQPVPLDVIALLDGSLLDPDVISILGDSDHAIIRAAVLAELAVPGTLTAPLTTLSKLWDAENKIVHWLVVEVLLKRQTQPHVLPTVDPLPFSKISTKPFLTRRKVEVGEILWAQLKDPKSEPLPAVIKLLCESIRPLHARLVASELDDLEEDQERRWGEERKQYLEESNECRKQRKIVERRNLEDLECELKGARPSRAIQEKKQFEMRVQYDETTHNCAVQSWLDEREQSKEKFTRGVRARKQARFIQSVDLCVALHLCECLLMPELFKIGVRDPKNDEILRQGPSMVFPQIAPFLLHHRQHPYYPQLVTVAIQQLVRFHNRLWNVWTLPKMCDRDPFRRLRSIWGTSKLMLRPAYESVTSDGRQWARDVWTRVILSQLTDDLLTDSAEVKQQSKGAADIVGHLEVLLLVAKRLIRPRVLMELDEYFQKLTVYTDDAHVRVRRIQSQSQVQVIEDQLQVKGDASTTLIPLTTHQLRAWQQLVDICVQTQKDLPRPGNDKLLGLVRLAVTGKMLRGVDGITGFPVLPEKPLAVEFAQDYQPLLCGCQKGVVTMTTVVASTRSSKATTLILQCTSCEMKQTQTIKLEKETKLEKNESVRMWWLKHLRNARKLSNVLPTTSPSVKLDLVSGHLVRFLHKEGIFQTLRSAEGSVVLHGRRVSVQLQVASWNATWHPKTDQRCKESATIVATANLTKDGWDGVYVACSVCKAFKNFNKPPSKKRLTAALEATVNPRELVEVLQRLIGPPIECVEIDRSKMDDPLLTEKLGPDLLRWMSEKENLQMVDKVTNPAAKKYLQMQAGDAKQYETVTSLFGQLCAHGSTSALARKACKLGSVRLAMGYDASSDTLLVLPSTNLACVLTSLPFGPLLPTAAQLEERVELEQKQVELGRKQKECEDQKLVIARLEQNLLMIPSLEAKMKEMSTSQAQSSQPVGSTNAADAPHTPVAEGRTDLELLETFMCTAGEGSEHHILLTGEHFDIVRWKELLDVFEQHMRRQDEAYRLPEKFDQKLTKEFFAKFNCEKAKNPPKFCVTCEHSVAKCNQKASLNCFDISGEKKMRREKNKLQTARIRGIIIDKRPVAEVSSASSCPQ